MGKILALTPFHIYPPTFGGAERCWELLSRVGETDVIALNWDGLNARKQIGDVNYQLIAADQAAIDQAIRLRNTGVQTFDTMPSLTKTKLTTIRKAIDAADPDLIVLEHPWLVDLIDGRPYILDAHNFETYNTGSQFGTTSYDYQLVKDIEGHAVEQAEHVAYCSTDDFDMLHRTFRTPSGTHIPNGVNLPDRVSDGTTRNLIFIGSAYGPNVTAAMALINQASRLRDFNVQILGQCVHYLPKDVPDNVQLIGPVNAEQLDDYFANAYAFINLITHGSGTHLKIARALAYGLPILTTKHGARGYRNLIHTTAETLPTTLKQLDWRSKHHEALEQARNITWDAIGTRYRQLIHSHL